MCECECDNVCVVCVSVCECECDNVCCVCVSVCMCECVCESVCV